MTDKPAESAVERWERQYGPGSYGRALNWMACSNVFNSIDAALTELQAERDAAVRERDIWRDMYRHSVRPVCGSEMAYEAQMKYDREASRARLYTKQRREETWADSPPIETEDGYV